MSADAGCVAQSGGAGATAVPHSGQTPLTFPVRSYSQVLQTPLRCELRLMRRIRCKAQAYGIVNRSGNARVVPYFPDHCHASIASANKHISPLEETANMGQSWEIRS